VHAASLVELRDGRLRTVWFSGSREGAGDVVIRTAVMDAASQRWSEEGTLHRQAADSAGTLVLCQKTRQQGDCPRTRWIAPPLEDHVFRCFVRSGGKAGLHGIFLKWALIIFEA